MEPFYCGVCYEKHERRKCMAMNEGSYFVCVCVSSMGDNVFDGRRLPWNAGCHATLRLGGCPQCRHHEVG